MDHDHHLYIFEQFFNWMENTNRLCGGLWEAFRLEAAQADMKAFHDGNVRIFGDPDEQDIGFGTSTRLGVHN